MLSVGCDRAALLVESAVKRVVSAPAEWVAERSSSRSQAVGRRGPAMVIVRCLLLPRLLSAIVTDRCSELAAAVPQVQAHPRFPRAQLR